MNTWPVLVAIMLAINGVTSVLFWIDKRRARAGVWRIRERTLLVWCALGGWPAAYVSMRTLRHKTRDRSFLTRYTACVVFWVVGLGAAVWNAAG